MATINKAVFKKALRAGTNPIRMMPDFIIIGAMRGGTTSLYSYLTDHPNIGPAYMKEVHFFDVHYHKGLPWYRAQFPSSVQKYYTEHIQKQQFITGEASPYYLFHPHAAKRMAKMLPQVKLVVLLRNPINRAYSHYYHEVAGGHEKLPTFEEAIDCEQERIGKEAEELACNERYMSYKHRHFSYLSRGIYVDQLKVWMGLFPRAQFLILKSEDFYADPAAGLQQVLEFVNVPSVGLAQKEEYEHLNTTKPAKMNAATRKRLIEYFEPHNARLYEYLGVDFGWDK